MRRPQAVRGQPAALPFLARDRDVWLRTLDEPRRPPALPKPGCGRPRGPWHLVQDVIQDACDDASPQRAWDAVLAGLEAELLGRFDLVGDKFRM